MRSKTLGLVAVTTCACGLASIAMSGCSSSGGSSQVANVSYPVDADLLAKAAVVVGSCAPDDGPNGWLNAWLSNVYAPNELEARLAAAARCLATTGGGCNALRTCAGLSVDQSGPCDRACAGNVATECEGNTKYVSDCARVGQVCVNGRCRPSGAACDATTFSPSCDQGAPKICSSALVRGGPKCADFGLSCGVASTSGGTPTCRGDGPACAGSYGPYSIDLGGGLACDGARLRACVGGQEAVIDCARIGVGFSCQTLGGAFFCGVAAECNPLTSKGTDACDGASVVLCAAGKAQRIDCKSLGFAGCDASKGICTPNGGA